MRDLDTYTSLRKKLIQIHIKFVSFVLKSSGEGWSVEGINDYFKSNVLM